MKFKLFCIQLFFMAVVIYTTCASTTINSTNHNAYGANTGWIEARGDVTKGAVIGQSFCSGYFYSANCGWISLGNGPTNGWQYSNLSSNDWGVNHDGAGNLSGYAYGANIGWINFEQTFGQAGIDLRTGNLTGYAWSANTGWISLSNAQAYVQTDTISPGIDSDSDGIPDQWECRMAGTLSTLFGGGHDQDGDGVSDVDEYLADTDPLDNASLLMLTDLQCFSVTNSLTWTIEQTRFYQLQSTDILTGSVSWVDGGLGLITPDIGAFMTRELIASSISNRYYRIRATVPLTP